MAVASQITGKTGSVTIGDKVFTIMPLTQREERRLRLDWEALAKTKQSKRIREAFAIASMAPSELLAQAAAARVVDRFMTDIDDEAWMEARDCPEGVAIELFHRCRKTHPDATLDSFRLIVNSVNYEDVDDQIRKATSTNVAAAGEDPK